MSDNLQMLPRPGAAPLSAMKPLPSMHDFPMTFSDVGLTGALVSPRFTDAVAIQKNITATRNLMSRTHFDITSDLIRIAAPGLNWGFLSANTERTESELIFDAIQALYINTKSPHARQIADRITALHRIALSEGERISPKALVQFKDFFVSHPQLGVPKITLTPNETLRARWIHGPDNFVAVEFTGEPIAKLVVEVPRKGGITARHFSSETVDNIIAVAQAIGVSFA